MSDLGSNISSDSIELFLNDDDDDLFKDCDPFQLNNLLTKTSKLQKSEDFSQIIQENEKINQAIIDLSKFMKSNNFIRFAP